MNINKQSPKISVIMTSFNYGKYISNAIESVIRQNYLDWELVIVDDGSTDNSMEIMEKYVAQDSRIHCFHHTNSQNLGIQKSIELGLKNSFGDWIAFLESDDQWESTCLKNRIEIAYSFPQVGLIYNSIKPLQMEGADLTWVSSYIHRIKNKVGQLAEPVDLSTQILYENLIPTFSSAMVKKHILRSCNFNSLVPEWLDWFLWCQVLQQTNALVINEELTNWRIHNESLNKKKAFIPYLIQSTKFRQGARF